MIRIGPVVLAFCATAAAAFATAAHPSALSAQAVEAARGERLFVAQCSRCHGIEGSGGQGPVLARPILPRGQSVDQIASLITEGIPDGGMPGTWTLSEDEVLLISEYVLTLGRVAVVELSGDPGRGQELFFNEGRCSRCHIVSGRGNGFGPELSDVGARRGADNLRRSITEPDAELPLGIGILEEPGFRSHLTIRVRDSGGEETMGVRLNEDAFTVQIMDRRGGIHSVRKAEREVEKQFGLSMMPTRDLTPEQIEDLVAYLANLRGVTWKSVS